MARKPTRQEIWDLPLRQQALKVEELRHAARLRELKKIDAQLALLEEEHAAIKAAGYTISGAEIDADLMRGGLHFLPRAILKSTGDAYRALVAVGFQLVDRGVGRYRIVRLQKGRLKVSMGMAYELIDELSPEIEPTAEAA